MKSLKAGGALLAVLTLFLLATGMVPVRVISATNYEAEQINAANYIENRYDERLGLVSKSEDARAGRTGAAQCAHSRHRM
jgi:hypothetical protein